MYQVYQIIILQKCTWQGLAESFSAQDHHPVFFSQVKFGEHPFHIGLSVPCDSGYWPLSFIFIMGITVTSRKLGGQEKWKNIAIKAQIIKWRQRNLMTMNSRTELNMEVRGMPVYRSLPWVWMAKHCGNTHTRPTKIQVFSTQFLLYRSTQRVTLGNPSLFFLIFFGGEPFFRNEFIEWLFFWANGVPWETGGLLTDTL